MEPQPAEGAGARIEDISTEWAVVRDPARFVLRYARAVQRYLEALIPNRHDAEEVAQDFFLRVTQHGFVRARKERGRFRDYLKAAVRHAALNLFRRNRPANATDSGVLLALIPNQTRFAADQAWAAEWRQCLLDRACRALKKHESRSPGNLFHTVLGMLADHPLDDTQTLARKTSALVGRPVSAAAFRKQVSRARRMLAKLLIQEVAQTLDNPTPERIKEELMELALWGYIRGFVGEQQIPPG